jgi:DNA repair protein RecN (Recombination protein N)
MLRDLRVRDLGVIEDLELRLEPGMTALTGETGAGKTLVVEALQLVLGGRATAGLVRAGAAEALVEARFEQAGPDPGELGDLVLARSVPVSGRSRAWIDGRMAPLGALAERAASLVDIHGQHEHQSLVHPAAQRAALDAFAGIDLGPVEAARRRLQVIDHRLAELGGDDRARAREAALLEHDLDEIGRAALTDPEEEAALRADEARLADLGAHRLAAAEAVALLAGADEGGGSTAGALELLARAAAALGGRPAFDAWEARLRQAIADVEDLGHDLRQVVEGWEDDPVALEQVQARRRLLADLRHKHGPTLADVIAYAEVSRRRLDDLGRMGEEAAGLQQVRAAAERELTDAEAVVRHARAAAAPALAAAVQGRLATLAMAGARLEVSVGERGAGEPVRFLFGANPGEPLQPLQRVASGGELARAMLALRLVAADGPATMVFDEVDAGVGGQAALALAGALAQVAAGRQVVVVTHLAQVAAFADQQIAVRKVTRGTRTTTAAAVLDPAERVVEISRMLSGQPDSAAARAHAGELLALGRDGGSSTTDGATVV